MIKSLRADGVSLNTAAQSVGVQSNPWAVPGAKGQNVSVPARHGSLWVADKSFDEASMSLQILVEGARDNGSVPLDQLGQTRTNIDRLLRIFTKRKNLIHLQAVNEHGTEIEAHAECLGAFDLTRSSDALPFAKFSVGLILPEVFWRDAVSTIYTSPSGLTSNQSLRMPVFEGGTAPMDDGIYLVHGPVSDPEIQVVETGAYTRYQGRLEAGETWRINASDWSSIVGPRDAVTFTSNGHTSVIGSTIHGGSASLVDVPPLGNYDLAIEFGGTNTGAETQLETLGRRKYLIS